MTKKKYTEKVEIRCTQGLKSSIRDAASFFNMTMTELLEFAFNDKILVMLHDRQEKLKEKMIASDVAACELPFKLSSKENIAELQSEVGDRVLRMKKKMTAREISEILNSEGIKTSDGNDWTKSRVNYFARTLRRNMKK